MNLIQLSIVILAAVGVVMMFGDQLLVVWDKVKSFFKSAVQPSPSPVSVELDTNDMFSKIRHLITLAEQSEAAGVDKAGELLRQAAATALLDKKVSVVNE
jgi:hypothetical protein